jgi:hypothetical protein
MTDILNEPGVLSDSGGTDNGNDTKVPKDLSGLNDDGAMMNPGE